MISDGEASVKSGLTKQISLQSLRHVFPGWWVVLACSGIGAYGGGVYFNGFTLFFNPLKEELGLTSAQTSLIFALSRLEGAFEGALVGLLIDRFGARRVMMVGIPLAGIGFLLWAMVVHSYLMFALVYVGLISTGINAGFFHPGLAVANNWFIRQRAMAMSVLGISDGVGGAILVPFLGLSIATLGWRSTAFLAGIGFLLIWPLTLLVHHRPEAKGLRPDGDPPLKGEETSPQAATLGHAHALSTHHGNSAPTADEPQYTVGQALRTRAMWLLTTALTIRLFTHIGIMVHLAPIMIDRGMSTVAAGGAVGLLSLLSIPGRLASGWLGGHFTKRKVIACLLVADLSGLVVLLYGTAVWHTYLFIVLWATGYGAGLLTWAVVGDYFGRTHFATIRGLMGLAFSVGGVLGPLYAGWVYDTTGNYSQAIRAFLAVTTVATILYWFCYPPSLRHRSAPPPEPHR